MIEVRPFFKEDVADLTDPSRPKTVFWDYVCSDKNVRVLEDCADAWTAYNVETDEVLMCAGVFTIWPGRGIGWALFNERKAGSHFVTLDRMVRQFLKTCDVKRIEIQVQYGFEKGHRWARSLEFKLEAPKMKGFFPTGEDGSLYARIK